MILSSLSKSVILIRVCVILLWLSLCSCAYTQEIIVPEKGTTLRKTLLDTVRVKAEQELETKVIFKVSEFRTDGRWAFLSARPLTESSTTINYAKTKFAKQFKEGMFDDFLTALLFKEFGAEWKLIAFSMGSTDASFVDWSEKYGVPELIVIPE